ncbi:MAG: thioredoxin domain-containing protein [Acidobacteriia bacterium]|nr:thioredoxin domain-containing protein [Terriglobia bacterium]
MRKALSLALSLLGLFDSLYLLWVYTSPTRPLVCLGSGCDAVRASAYSHLWGAPIPIFGVAAYAALALLLFAEALLPGLLARATQYLVILIASGGFCFSLYLSYLEARVIHAWCAWCVVSALTITTIFLLSLPDAWRQPAPTEPAAKWRAVQSRFAVFALALVVGIPAFIWLSRHGEAPPVQTASPQALLERLVRQDSPVWGDPQAPVTVVEFGDFECPVCGQAEEVAREIRAKYGDRIKFVFRQFPLSAIHPWAEKAAEASLCAQEQGKFWPMTDKLYMNQTDLSVDALKRYAGELGLDMSRFNTCLASGAMAARVQRDVDDAHALGLDRTPLFFVDRKMVAGALPFKEFAQLIDQELAAHPVQTAETTGTQVNTAVQTGKSPVRPDIRKTAATTAQDPVGGASESAFGQSGGSIFQTIQGSSAGCSEAEAAQRQPPMIHTQDLQQLLAGGAKPLFVDVRSPKEFAAGHIPDALNIPVDNMQQRWGTLPKNRTIVLYESGRSTGDICAASRASGRTLLTHGFPFEHVKVYQDGLEGWEKAGLSVQR